MNILAIADRPPSKSIKQLISEQKIDLIVTLGDLELDQIRKLEKIDSIPKIGVYGNHCSGNYFKELGIIDMHLNHFEMNDITFGGFEGCVRYKESPYAIMYSQQEASDMLKNYSRVDVLLTHSPPFGVNDNPEDLSHTGFNALRDYVENMKPNYLLHGHTYPKEGEIVTQLGSTEIVYVQGSRVLTIEEPND